MPNTSTVDLRNFDPEGVLAHFEGTTLIGIPAGLEFISAAPLFADPFLAVVSVDYHNVAKGKKEQKTLSLRCWAVATLIYRRSFRGLEAITNLQGRHGFTGDDVKELPGGMYDVRNPAEVAVEEVLQETGVRIDINQLIHIGTFAPDPARSVHGRILFAYEADANLEVTELIVQDDGEHIRKRGKIWESVDDLLTELVKGNLPDMMLCTALAWLQAKLAGY